MATYTSNTTEAEYTEGHAIKRISRDGNDDSKSSKQAQDSIEKVDHGSSDPDPNTLPEGVQYPTGVKFWLLMFNLAAVIILGSIDMSIVATAVPRITDHFHTVADVGWYSIAFRLCQCSFQFL